MRGGRSYKEVVAKYKTDEVDKLMVGKEVSKNSERAPMMYDVGNAIHSTVNNGGGGTSIVLVSLSHSGGNRRLVMLVKSNGNSNGEDSNLPVFNDASFCKQIDRQSHHIEKAEPKSGKSLTVEPSIGGYMSFLGRTSAGAFMEDETDLIKRREEEDVLASLFDV
ncbi:hypothetical protein Ancab_017278 [Ancistrocladus abbreviatus]